MYRSYERIYSQSHAPGAIGPIARQEARTHLLAQFFVVPAASTSGTAQPPIKPAVRDLSTSHIHPASQIPRCFAMKANLTCFGVPLGTVAGSRLNLREVGRSFF
jgi:hypothetical protein